MRAAAMMRLPVGWKGVLSVTMKLSGAVTRVQVKADRRCSPKRLAYLRRLEGKGGSKVLSTKLSSSAAQQRAAP